jgi:hypothetical protein
LQTPVESARSQLAKELNSISLPDGLSIDDDLDDPLAVYRSIRDNCEYITDVLIRVATYVDQRGTHASRISQLRETLKSNKASDYDYAFCSVRICSGLEASATLSIIIARSLQISDKNGELKRIEGMLLNLSPDDYKHNASCVEVTATAWDLILSRMAQVRSQSLVTGQIKKQFSRDGRTMARLRTSFDVYARLLEDGCETLAIGSRNGIDKIRTSRVRTSRESTSTYINIWSATSSLVTTHTLLAESM